MSWQNLLVWQHLLDVKGLAKMIMAVAAVIMAVVVIYLGLVEKDLFPYRLFLALPIVIIAFLYGLPGGAISSLAIVIPLYIWDPEVGTSELTAFLLIGLVPGILREGLTRENKQLEALRQIDLAILSRAPLRHATNIVVDEVIKLLGVDDVRIFLYDRDKDELVIYHDFRIPLPSELPMPHRLKPDQGLAGMVFTQRSPITVRDMWSDPRIIPREAVKKMGLRSALAVPLIIGQEPNGVFAIFTKSRRHFSKGEVRAVERLAGQLAIALEAARAEQQAEEKAARFSALYDLDRAILAQKPLTEVLNLAARLAAELMKADACLIGLVGEKEQEISISAQFGYTEEEIKLIEQFSLKVGEGSWGWAVLQKQTVVVPDVRKDPRFSRLLPLLDQVPTTATMAVPLLTNGTVIGAIRLRYRESHRFSHEEVEFFTGFARQIAIAIKQADFINQIRDLSLETIRALTITLDARDPYTAGHSQRVAGYAVTIGDRMGLPKERLELLQYAGLLHDVGKIGCAETAWQKPGRLDNGESAEMKKHPYVSAQILKAIKFLNETVPWVYHHHERFDGQGYPDRLKETEIPLESRILLVADAYDAMTSDRSYRPALGQERALRELVKNAGKQFDPEVVKASLEVFAATDV